MSATGRRSLSDAAARGPIILDGGLATELERRGASLDDPLWSAKLLLDNPELIEEVHLDYLRAGAQVVTAASYQAFEAGFARHGLDASQARRLFTFSVEAAKQARERFLTERGGKQSETIWVAASIGPYGATLADGSEYLGDYGLSVRSLVDFHRGRFETLTKSGADLLACETIPTVREAEALLSLLEESPDTQAWFTFTCRDERTTAAGEPLTEVARLLSGSAQVVAMGVNCVPPDLVVGAAATLRPLTAKPLIAYPNSGERWDAATREWMGSADSKGFATKAKQWSDQGISLIGGCCRTTPEHIRLVRDQLLGAAT